MTSKMASEQINPSPTSTMAKLRTSTYYMTHNGRTEWRKEHLKFQSNRASSSAELQRSVWLSSACLRGSVLHCAPRTRHLRQNLTISLRHWGGADRGECYKESLGPNRVRSHSKTLLLSGPRAGWKGTRIILTPTL